MKGVWSRILVSIPTDDISLEHCALVRGQIRQLLTGLSIYVAERNGNLKINVRRRDHGEPVLKKKKVKSKC